MSAAKHRRRVSTSASEAAAVFERAERVLQLSKATVEQTRRLLAEFRRTSANLDENCASDSGMRSILPPYLKTTDRAKSMWVCSAFRPGDKVEEISTGRRGTVGASGTAGRSADRVTVQFSDGQLPLLKDFKHSLELRVIEAPGERGAPALRPKGWVV